MYPKLSKFQPTIFLLCFLLVLNIGSAGAEETTSPTKPAYLIKEIRSNLQGDALSIEIIGDSSPVYTMYDLFNPPRLILDIANAGLDKKINPSQIIPDNSYAQLTTKPVTDQDPNILRFEITIKESHTYSIDREQNNLLLLIHPKSETAQAAAPTTSSDAAASASSAQSAAAPVKLHQMLVNKGPEQTKVLIVADSPLKEFRHDIVSGKKGLPEMMFVDINGVDGSALVRETEVGTALSKIRIAPKGNGLRLLFESGLPALFNYTVTSDPQGLLVTIEEAKTDSPTNLIQAPGSPADTALDGIIGSSASVTSKATAPENSAGKNTTIAMEDSFNFGGYKDTKRISVDFFKIDLHNAFRLFREISGVNIIVDDAVQGSLTLALNDVPWDFALDIILNLKDLRKEERYNTIVIYPASKEFFWPERTEENLSVEADLEIVQEETLIIEQSAAQSEEIIKSKELTAKGRIEQKNENIEKAIAYYEQALKLDPKNARLSNRLASLYLVNLGINAKAVYFAKETLKIEPKNTQAALYAAIGLANMNQIAEATDYFAQSISDPIPSKEALISYASFCEQNGQPDNALKLINRYNTIYGESVDTMVSKARIYDQMGQAKMADEQYRALLASGYPLVPGLKQYIQDRLASKSVSKATAGTKSLK